MSLVRFIMVGGFLGSGKTTLLGRLARHYLERGRRVGVITNDQAENLVDTRNFREQGLAAAEIPGGCFCCRFNALADAAARLARAERPDILLAEPVGSCTDLIATVVQPLKRLYTDQYRIAPYPVLVDPVRVRKILTGDRQGGFSPKVAYIYHKQLEEADAIAVNKADTLTEEEHGELCDLVRRHFPGKEVLLISGRSGHGMETLLDLLDRDGAYGRHIPEIDYDTYAEGEAELGWLNCTAALAGDADFSADELLTDLAQAIRQLLVEHQCETAHLKMLLHAGGGTAIANLVRSDAVAELSRRAESTARREPQASRIVNNAELIVNARVHADPETLLALVRRGLDQVCRRRGLTANLDKIQHFRPARPVPTYRFAADAGY